MVPVVSLEIPLLESQMHYLYIFAFLTFDRFGHSLFDILSSVDYRQDLGSFPQVGLEKPTWLLVPNVLLIEKTFFFLFLFHLATTLSPLSLVVIDRLEDRIPQTVEFIKNFVIISQLKVIPGDRMREQRGLPFCISCFKIVYIKSSIQVHQCSPFNEQ